MALRTIYDIRTMNRTLPPKYIVLSPLYNFFVEGTSYPANWEQSSFKYRWYKLQQYFSHDLQQHELPFHWWAEYVDKDYAINVACPFTHRSHYIETLLDMKCLNYSYRESLLIAFDQDVRLEPVDRRMMEILGYQLIAPLLKTYKLDMNRLVFIDDIIEPNARELLSENRDLKLRYKYSPAKYYDHNITKTIIKEFLH